MSVQNIVEKLSGSGVTLWLAGEALKFRPKVDTATVDLLREKKPEIVAYLRAKDVDTLSRLYLAVQNGEAAEDTVQALHDRLFAAELAGNWEDFRAGIDLAKMLLF